MKSFLLFLLGCWFYAAPVVAAQQEPIIETVRVSPLPFNAATGVVVEPVLADETARYSFTYRWFLNGEEAVFATSAAFPGELLRRGDELAIEVTPIDVDGTPLPPFVSLPLKAVNSSPMITSEPPSRFSPHGFRYQVAAADPDGDSLSYRLQGAPEGMTINGSSGELLWAYDSLPAGLFSVLIIVTDDYAGRAEQSLELDLSYVPKEKVENQ